jgi:hypothetical protein
MAPSYVAVAYPAGGVPPMVVAAFWLVALALIAAVPWLVAPRAEAGRPAGLRADARGQPTR